MGPLIDRRTLLAGGVLLLTAAADSPDALARAALDDAAKLPPPERLAALRHISRHGLSAGVQLDIVAAVLVQRRTARST